MSTTFADLGVPAPLVSALSKRGITEPFPVQAVTLPDALAGRDILGRAPTGSGKTLGFGLPLLARVGKAASKRPRALVLAPTRELAEQIRNELLPLASSVHRKVVAVYGGASYHPQRAKLRQGADILVACPGRLLDLIQQRDVQLSDVDLVVVDEADRMADMGFMPQVRELLDMTSPDRQTLLFSATLDGDVAALTARYQNDPVRHEVGRAATDTGESRHFFWKVEQEERLDHTAQVITQSGPTIVFTRTRHGADRLAKQLDREGVKAAAIHGGRSQGQRRRALSMFSGGNVEVLVATDVAARGIHVDDVACVVHFDPPADIKDYLHRSGRTARAGASGKVVSFISRNQVRTARRMQRDLGLSDWVIDPDHEALSLDGGERIGENADRNADRSDDRQDNGDRRGRNGASRGGGAPGRGGQQRRRRPGAGGGQSSGGYRHHSSGKGRPVRDGEGRPVRDGEGRPARDGDGEARRPRTESGSETGRGDRKPASANGRRKPSRNGAPHRSGGSGGSGGGKSYGSRNSGGGSQGKRRSASR